jgi:hypothetical protein
MLPGWHPLPFAVSVVCRAWPAPAWRNARPVDDCASRSPPATPFPVCASRSYAARSGCDRYPLASARSSTALIAWTRARRLWAQFYRHARVRAKRLVHKIEIQRVLKRRIERMVIRYGRFAQPEPAVHAFAASVDLDLCGDHGAHAHPSSTAVA